MFESQFDYLGGLRKLLEISTLNEKSRSFPPSDYRMPFAILGNASLTLNVFFSETPSITIQMVIVNTGVPATYY